MQTKQMTLNPLVASFFLRHWDDMAEEEDGLPLGLRISLEIGFIREALRKSPYYESEYGKELYDLLPQKSFFEQELCAKHFSNWYMILTLLKYESSFKSIWKLDD